ncbi:MAG: exodeoxyribonuclease III [Halobacteriovoraceae bacterium]|nr:exodeoxyribonuclease III [Halobacteriovoraceae bacterium]
MTQLITWNINGIRAVAKKGFPEWLKKTKASIICLQEIKATEDQIPEEIKNISKFEYVAYPAERKGYSGVMTLFKKAPTKTEMGLGLPKFDCEGRTLIHHFKDFILLNCYFPNGSRDLSRVPYKLEYCQAISKKVAELTKKNKKPVIVCGDYNTAHHKVDLSNPKSNKNTTGFLEIERQWIDQFIQEGNADCFRELYPKKKDVYSWWTYRNNCRERNIGWRIDYFFISQKGMSSVDQCRYLNKIEGSDHCPVELTLSSEMAI